MSELPENENLNSNVDEGAEYKDEFDEFETIFQDPTQHIEKKKKNTKKSKTVAVISGLLAVLILVGGTLTVIKFIPEKETDNESSQLFEDITLIDSDTSDLSKVTVKNSNGKFGFYSVTTVTEAESSESSSGDSSSDTESSEPEEVTTWYVDGIKKDLTSSSTIEGIIGCAASLTASRKIDTKTESDCGLDKPQYTVEVTTKKKKNYTIYVGDKSPDSTGTYVKLSNKDGIYIADDSNFSYLEFEKIDLADNSAFSPVSFTGDVSKYYSDSTLSTFDQITLSGKKYKDTVVIKPNTDTRFSDYMPYVVKKPFERYADNIDKITTVFSSGIEVSGAYSFDVSSSSLKKFGLDNPDIIVTLTIKNQNKTYKISFVDDDYCAVINEQSKIIKKVALSSLEFATYSAEDFYSKWVSMQSINDISDFTVNVGGKTYKFLIDYDEDEEDDKYTITYNGKKLVSENFQNFYQYFVGMEASDFGTEKLSAKPDATISFTFKKSKAVKKITYTKCSATKYQYSIDGEPIGRVTSSSYNTFMRYLELLCAGKTVEL